jgi:uncharacterized protein (DUF2336 family)
VSASNFRQIPVRGEKGKADRLLRAAISAFCSLTRPSRREIAQIEDLALPLLAMASAETRRFVAAALSECREPPSNLVLRLADEPVDIAAPLLVRSAALANIDLIALIGRHGLSHALAIAKRPGLAGPVVQLIDSLLASRTKDTVPMQDAAAVAVAHIPAESPPAPAREPGRAAEETRQRLRAMMRAARPGAHFENGAGQIFDESAGAKHYEKLRSTALTGVRAFFQTALADALNIEFAKARALTETRSYSYLMVALRALDLDESQAFLLTSAVFPSMFGHPETIRLFLERYTVLHRDQALEQVGYWKIDAVADRMNAPANHGRPHGAGGAKNRQFKAS